MKNRLLTVLLCAFIVLCSVSVFADTEDDIGGAADIIVGDQSDTENDVVSDTASVTKPDDTDAPPATSDTTTKAPEVVKPPETTKTPEPVKPPETTKTPEPTKEPETTTQAPEPEPEPTKEPEAPSDPQTDEYPEEPAPVVTKDNDSSSSDKTTGKRPSTSKRDSDSTESDESESDSKPESTSADTDKKDEAKTSSSRFASPLHVVAFILGIPAIISFYALVAVVARRIVYGSINKDSKND